MSENTEIANVDVVKQEMVQNYFFTDLEKKPEFRDEVQNVSTQEQPKQQLTDTDIGGEAGALVDEALKAGVMAHIKKNGKVQEKLVNTANSVIDTKINVLQSQADKADKKAYFEANEAACSYFGYDEKTTNKSHVTLMKCWSWFFNTLYIVTIGFFLVAPITFFAHKLKVVIKKTWLVLLLAVLIYVMIVLAPFIGVWLGRI